jgi:hypothetical protein
MSLLSLSKLSMSPEYGWPELARERPSLAKVFALLVLPLSLLPPIMLYYAGTHHPEIFPGEAGTKDWARIALVFFLAELGTLAMMGWLVRQLAETSGLAIDYHDAYLLASIAPVPMWLSALGLLVPSLAFNVVVALAATGVSCALVHRGIEGLGRTREDVTAASITQIVIGAGLVAWALLLVLALI